jgi:hypothetical protein
MKQSYASVCSDVSWRCQARGEPGLFHLSSPRTPNARQRREFGTAHRKKAYQEHGDKELLLQNVYLQAELANPYIIYFTWPVYTPRVLVGQCTQPVSVVHRFHPLAMLRIHGAFLPHRQMFSWFGA